MLTIIGAVLGFFSSIVPGIFNYLGEKTKAQTEIQIMDIKKELIIKGKEQELESYKEQALDKEHKRLIEQDIAISKETGFIGNLRKSIRPVITYTFFALFLIVKLLVFFNALIYSNLSYEHLLAIVWDPQTSAIFAAIISFWFGSRAIEKGAQMRTSILSK